MILDRFVGDDRSRTRFETVWPEEAALSETTRAVIEPEALDRLVDALRARGFRVLGPTVRDGAIVYDELESAAELPIGWTDRQDGGTYRLERRDDEARFGYAVGPHSWKRFLFPPRVRLWRAQPERRRRARGRGGAARRDAARVHRRPLVRAARDRDPGPRLHSAARTSTATTRPAATARSSSPSTASSPAAPASAPRWEPGRRCEAGYDLALTELLDGEHRFLVEAGTERGAEVLAELPSRPRRAGRPRRRRARRSSRRRRRWAGRWSTCDLRDLLARQPRASALGRRRGALPHLRQLHARLPDVLLLGGRGRDRPLGRGGRALARLGHVLLGRLLLHPRRQHPAVGPLALPAVDDAQARHLARPVRLVGLRRLRPLHHLVPGRDRHHRGGRRDPRDGGSEHAHGLESAARRASVLRGARRHASSRLLAGCAGNVRFDAGAEPLPRGRRRPTRSTSSGTAASRSRPSCRRAAR